MGNLISLLGTGSNGLAAFTAQQQTASHNMANMNTAGYARQRVELAAQRPEFLMGNWLGRGVTMMGVSQARDAFLERQIPAALGSASRHKAESDALLSVGVLDPDAAGSLTEGFGRFFSDMRALSQNPGDVGLRSAFTGSTKNLSQTFNRIGGSIESARTGLDSKVEADVAETNDLSGRLARLNKEIVQARARGSEPNDMLDERIRVRDRLSQLTGATQVPDNQGNISMVLSSGMALVSGGEAATLSTVADVGNGGHLAVHVKRIGAPLVDSFSSSQALGGELRGLMDARDTTLRKSLDELDTLAFDFATAVNTQHQAGFDLNGAAGGTLFTVSATSAGAAQALSLNAAVASDPRLLAMAGTATAGPGDGTNLNLLLGVERQALSTGSDAGATLAHIISSFGSAGRSAKSLSEQDASIAKHLDGLRESTSGVSLDEEMVNMTQAQRAYEAMAKVISTTDEMLDVLMKLK